jgi:hypothetical protein
MKIRDGGNRLSSRFVLAVVNRFVKMNVKCRPPLTGHRVAVGSTVALHWVRPGFKSRLGDRLTSLMRLKLAADK